jgi:hypothetical protein
MEPMALASPPPQALVVLGASGDLARLKLLPALYDLAYEGLKTRLLSVVLACPRVAAPRSTATARIGVAVHALTGLNSKGSWPPTLLAISRSMNQRMVIAGCVAGVMPSSSRTTTI